MGAWSTRPWARTVGLVTAILGLVAGVVTLLTTGAIAHGFATFVFPIFLLWYLNRAKVKEASAARSSAPSHPRRSWRTGAGC